MTDCQVVKRDGHLEPLDINKIHKVIFWACEGLDDLSPSEIEMTASLQLGDGIETQMIHQVLINSARDLISEEHPDYQYAAARLVVFDNRKRVWGGIHPPELSDLITRLVDDDVYDPRLINNYSKAELKELNDYIDHDRDMNLTFAGITQLCDKYMMQDRTTGELFETPQFVFMCTAMAFFMEDDTPNRMTYVKTMYDALSKHKVNLPTPIIGGLRSTTNQYASCVLVDVDDTMDSIFNSNTAVGLYIGQRAGIGIGIGRIRALNSPIRRGAVSHTGQLPFIKMFAAATRSCTQNGIRGGNSTIYYPFWHKDFESLIVLRNNKGEEDTRERRADYAVQLTKLFYDRVKNDEEVSLFNPYDVPGLFEAFCTSADKFKEVYTTYENDPDIPRETLSAKTMMKQMLLAERYETGKVYYMNMDYANEHSPFDVPITMSNLCVAYETKILTDEGEQEIGPLVGQKVNVWNGLEYSEVEIVQTGSNQRMHTVTFTDGTEIDCTMYHKYYVKDEEGDIVEKRAHELKEGDVTIPFHMPNKKGEPDESKEESEFVVESFATEFRRADSFCFTEPKRNMGVFNGVLTGNCTETLLPTVPIQSMTDENGEIATCLLMCYNLGRLEDVEKEVRELAPTLIRAEDNLIDLQDYPVKAAEKFTKERRALLIGWNDVAHYLAKQGIQYSSDEAAREMSRVTEILQYQLLDASMNLAKERGPCAKFNETKYSRGLLPIDHYCKGIDEVVDTELYCDWERLRKDIVEHGLRHSTLTGQPPCESSSVVSNSTNGIEPPRDIVSYKRSKRNQLVIVVPESDKVKYEFAFDREDNSGQIKLVGAMQKWMDQGISANLYYEPARYENGKVPMKVLVRDMVLTRKYGWKTAYYTVTDDDNRGSDNEELNEASDKDNSTVVGTMPQEPDDLGCESGACAI